MQSPQITPSLPLGQAPHAVRRPPCRAAASRFHIPVFHATFVLHAIPRPPHTWAASSYGIAVSPYGHTPDVSPHTFWQIPIGRPFSHSHGISPIARPFPHTIYIIDKAAGFHFDETSVRSPQIPTNPDKQTPWTCVTVRQTNPQPVPTNHMRYGPANQAPAKSSKYYMPAKVGGWHLLRSRLHGHAHIIMPSRARAHSRPWSYIHGYAHTFTGMRTPSWARACTRTIVTLSRAHLHGHGA